MKVFADFKCRYISTEEIREIADNFFQETWDHRNLPVDIELIAEKIGLEIIPEYVSDTMDAYLKVDAQGIIVNSKLYSDDKYINRLRFSIAHEIGHFVLHKGIISQLQFNTIEEYIDFIEKVPNLEYNRFEQQANEFAGRLLVPYKRLKIEIEGALSVLRKNNLMEMMENDPEQVLSHISPALCKPFGVSEQVLEIRVLREKLWPPEGTGGK